MYSPRQKSNNGRYLLIYALLGIMNTAWILGTELAGGFIPVLIPLRNVFMRYTSVPVFGSAVCLLMHFSGIELNPKGYTARFCGWCSPLVFSVYLIHDHPLTREYWMWNRFAQLGKLHPGCAIISAVVAAIGLFAACIMFDWVRERLFWSLKIPIYSDKISQWLTRKIVIRLKGNL